MYEADSLRSCNIVAFDSCLSVFLYFCSLLCVILTYLLSGLPNYRSRPMAHEHMKRNNYKIILCLFSHRLVTVVLPLILTLKLTVNLTLNPQPKPEADRPSGTDSVNAARHEYSAKRKLGEPLSNSEFAA